MTLWSKEGLKCRLCWPPAQDLAFSGTPGFLEWVRLGSWKTQSSPGCPRNSPLPPLSAPLDICYVVLNAKYSFFLWLLLYNPYSFIFNKQFQILYFSPKAYKYIFSVLLFLLHLHRSHTEKFIVVMEVLGKTNAPRKNVALTLDWGSVPCVQAHGGAITWRKTHWRHSFYMSNANSGIILGILQALSNCLDHRRGHGNNGKVNC